MHEGARRVAFLVALAALVTVPAGLGGCLDFLPDQFTPKPDYAVARTAVKTGPGTWNTDGTFVVQVSEPEPLEVTIVATPASGLPLSAQGLSDATRSVTLEIPDGTWTITYTVDGYEWETFRSARFDSTPPTITGLEEVGYAPTGSYTLGQDAVVEPGVDVEVRRQDTGALVATALPAQLSGLGDAVYAYDVVAHDEAGNPNSWPVQVVAGSATQLPQGQLTMGIVARYRTTSALWDITDLTRYLSPAAARQAAPDFLGSGVGITPEAPEVTEVVDEVVQPGMTTAQAALVLYEWMFTNLDYDKERLEAEETNLLDPAETIAAGGGVCRDLAALYVSLLRAADVPARLVAGYLGGEVNGFHAWVEFYGGLAPIGEPSGSPWVPVDVSGITGAYDVLYMMQAFGVRQPEYLMLRAVTPEQEQTDWASAMTLSEETPQSVPRGSTPVEFENLLADVIEPSMQYMCINSETYFRTFRPVSTKCPTPGGQRLRDPVVTAATQVLDYGVRVGSGPAGTKFILEVTFPDSVDTSAESVEFLTYAPGSSSGCPRTEATGRATCTLQR